MFSIRKIRFCSSSLAKFFFEFHLKIKIIDEHFQRVPHAVLNLVKQLREGLFQLDRVSLRAEDDFRVRLDDVLDYLEEFEGLAAGLDHFVALHRVSPFVELILNEG
jgi:hypothetical protein